MPADVDFKLESEFLNRFVVSTKRERLVGFASKLETRGRFLNELRSPSIFDPRYIIEINGSDRMPGTLPAIFKQYGMGGRVYVISENEEWDAQKFQMSYIVDQCLGMGFDTVGYCWKTKTAFYEWHHSESSYFLKRNQI